MRTKPEFGSSLLKFLNQALAYSSKYLNLGSSFFLDPSDNSRPIPSFPISILLKRSKQNRLIRLKMLPRVSYFICAFAISASVVASGFTISFLATLIAIGRRLLQTVLIPFLFPSSVILTDLRGAHKNIGITARTFILDPFKSVRYAFLSTFFSSSTSLAPLFP